MIRFSFYCQFSVALTALIIYQAYSKYEQFYPTGVYLATANHALLVIANFAVLLAYLFGKLVIKIFLEKVHERELDLLYDRLKTSITDTILALTIFREHFNAKFVFLLLILLFSQVFHWLTKYRVEYIEHSPYHFGKNVKLFILLSSLFFFDVIFLSLALRSLFTDGINAMMLFSLEYGLLLVSALSTLVSFFINIEGIKREGRWDQKGLYILYLEFFSEGIKTILYGLFFIVSLIHLGLPIHIIRQLFISFRTFYRRFQDLLQYQTIMNERFLDATDQELENSDKICIVCREDMVSGKKLPCGHILHLHCLRSWLERQQTCPICRALVIVRDPNHPAGFFSRMFRRRPPGNNNINNNNNNNFNNPQAAQNPIVQPHQVLAQIPQQLLPREVQQHLQQIQQHQQQQLQQQPQQLPQQQPQPTVLHNRIHHRIPIVNNINNNSIMFDSIPISHNSASTIDPQLQNDKDVVLHIMAMQNHIQFLNSQLDYVKNYLIIKNNTQRNNIDGDNIRDGNSSSSGSGSGNSIKNKIFKREEKEILAKNNFGDIEKQPQQEEDIEEIIGKPIKDDESSLVFERLEGKGEHKDEENENVLTAVAEGDSIDSSKDTSSEPIIHKQSDNNNNNDNPQNLDFFEQLRKRTAKHKSSPPLDKSNE